MPVAIQMPNRQEEKDPLDTIMKGLNIASTIYGFSDKKAEGEAKKLQDARLAEAQQMTIAKQNAEMGEKGYTVQKDPATGAVSYLRPPGYVNPADAKAAADLEHTKAQTERLRRPGADDGGVSALIREQRLRDMQRQAQEADLAKTPEGRMQKLSGTDKARLDNAKLGLIATQGMASALKSGQNTFSLVGDNDFTQQRTLFEEALGRMQSGGAISLAEENRFKKMAPTVFDSPQMQQKKLEQLQSEMASRISTLGFTPQQLGIQGAESDVVNVPKEMVAASKGGAFKLPGGVPAANAAAKPKVLKTNEIQWK